MVTPESVIEDVMDDVLWDATHEVVVWPSDVSRRILTALSDAGFEVVPVVRKSQA